MVAKTTKLNLGAAAAGLALSLACTMAMASPSQHEVFAVQNALYGAGFAVDHVDGKMGPATQQALRAYQEKHHLKVTGNIDNQTLIDLGVKLDAQTTASQQVKANLASYGIGTAPPGVKAESVASAKSNAAPASKAEQKKPATAGNQAAKSGEKPAKKKEKKKSGWWFW